MNGWDDDDDELVTSVVTARLPQVFTWAGEVLA